MKRFPACWTAVRHVCSAGKVFCRSRSGAGGEHPHSLAGDDPDREGSIDPSDRVVRAYEEWFAGYDQDPDELLERTFEETAGYDEMVLLRDIRFVSQCEHHMAAIFGRAHHRQIGEPANLAANLAGLDLANDAAGAPHLSRRGADVPIKQYLPPQALNPMPGDPSVMGGVLGITVPEVVLHGAQIGALVGQVVAARMAQHVRPDATELCSLASDPHDIIDGLAGELCLPLGRGWRDGA